MTPTTENWHTLPYIQGVHGQDRQLLRRFQIKTVFKHIRNLVKTLMLSKTGFHHSKPPEYTHIHMQLRSHLHRGESGRTIEERLREHIRDFKFKKVHRSAVLSTHGKPAMLFSLDKTRMLAERGQWWPWTDKERPWKLRSIPGTANGDAGLRLLMRGLHSPKCAAAGCRPPGPYHAVRCLASGPSFAVRPRTAPVRPLPPPPFTHLHSGRALLAVTSALSLPGPHFLLKTKRPTSWRNTALKRDRDMSVETSAPQPSTRRHPDSLDHHYINFSL